LLGTRMTILALSCCGSARVGRPAAAARYGVAARAWAPGRAGMLPAGVSLLTATVAVAGYRRASLGLP
jgi:hypothetical protein